MIDLDAIEKECQQMIADGLGFIAPKSCGNADDVAALVKEIRTWNQYSDALELMIGEMITIVDDFGHEELRDTLVELMGGVGIKIEARIDPRFLQ
ncbi:MAG: hypothetical protein ACRCXB_20750 [Aeromonadaceae bacterium]